MLAILFLVLPILAMAQSQSEQFALTQSVLDVAGGVSSSPSQSAISAFGQPTPTGLQSSPSFGLHAGFLSSSLFVSPLSPIQRLVIKEAQPDAQLYWESHTGAGSYSIYRASDINFSPGPGYLVATVVDTFYTDAGVLSGPALQQFYIVVSNRGQ